LTIGIIGNFIGTDADLIADIQGRLSVVSETGSQLELASHGWNHESFSNFSEPDQEMLLANSADKIQSLFGKATDVFLAPYNDWNGDTITALANKQFKILSSEVDLDPPPYNMVNPNIWHIPIQASTSKQTNEDQGFFPASHEETLDQIRSQLSNYGFAAVLLHPMEFHEFTEVNGTVTYGGVNQTQINELRLLLTALKNEGLVATSIGGVKRTISPDPVTTGTTGIPPKATTGMPPKATTGETRQNPVTTGRGSTTQAMPATTGTRIQPSTKPTQATQATHATKSTQSTPGTEQTQAPPNHEEVPTAAAVGITPAFSFCIAMVLLSRWLF